MCSRCRKNLKFGNFTLSFGRLRQRMHVLHVQHDYFSSFNQSDHCFSLVVIACFRRPCFKPGFHIVVSVVSVVSVVRKKFIGQIQLYGNLPYKCSIQKKLQIQLVVRDRMNSICPMNLFRTTETTDMTDTTIWKPGIKPGFHIVV